MGINFIVNLIQTAVQIFTLALGVPVIINNLVNITLQIGLAALQLLNCSLIPCNLTDDFRRVNLLPDFFLNIFEKAQIKCQSTKNPKITGGPAVGRPRKNLLAGLLKCPQCGGAMYAAKKDIKIKRVIRLCSPVSSTMVSCRVLPNVTLPI